MTSHSEREKATAAVDKAWRNMRARPSAEAEAAYDRAYAKWKELGRTRGVGRPPSGDSSLTSSERAQAGRARQQQAAIRWEKVAALVQRLRRAVDASDSAAIVQIAGLVARETAMTLTAFSVVHAQPDSDFVVLHGWHGKQMVIAFIPTMHLEDHFRSRRLTGKQANLLVDLNLDSFARIISAKYERGEYRPYSRSGSTFPRVDITLEDIETSGEPLVDSVLSPSPGWISPGGRQLPS